MAAVEAATTNGLKRFRITNNRATKKHFYIRRSDTLVFNDNAECIFQSCIIKYNNVVYNKVTYYIGVLEPNAYIAGTVIFQLQSVITIIEIFFLQVNR